MLFTQYSKIQKNSSYIEVELICPVPNDLVSCVVAADLVLVDFIATRSISIHIEDHRGASNS